MNQRNERQSRHSMLKRNRVRKGTERTKILYGLHRERASVCVELFIVQRLASELSSVYCIPHRHSPCVDTSPQWIERIWNQCVKNWVIWSFARTFARTARLFACTFYLFAWCGLLALHLPPKRNLITIATENSSESLLLHWLPITDKQRHLDR